MARPHRIIVSGIVVALCLAGCVEQPIFGGRAGGDDDDDSGGPPEVNNAAFAPRHRAIVLTWTLPQNVDGVLIDDELATVDVGAVETYTFSFATNNQSQSYTLRTYQGPPASRVVSVGVQVDARTLYSGELDPTFADNGVLILDTDSGFDAGSDVVMDGARILVAGSATTANLTQGALWALDATGALDMSFAGDGHAPLPAATPAGTSEARRLALDGNRIYVSGTGRDGAGTTDDIATWCWNRTTGGAVTAFDPPDGLAMVDGSGTDDRGFDVAKTNDCTLVSGAADQSNDGKYEGYVLCYLPTGALDTMNWGQGMTGALVLQQSTDDVWVRALAVDTVTGTLYAAGSLAASGSTSYRAATWLMADNGAAATRADLPDTGLVTDIYDIVAENDAIYSAGYSEEASGGGTEFTVACTKVGQYCTAFNGGNPVTLNVANQPDRAFALVQDAQQRWVVAGTLDGELVVVRMSHDGVLDLTFDGTVDGNGVVPFASARAGFGAAVDPQGRIIVVGRTGGAGSLASDLVVLRMAD